MSYFIASGLILGVHFGCHTLQSSTAHCTPEMDGTSKGPKAVFTQHSA